MKRNYLLVGITLTAGTLPGFLGNRMLSAQEPLKSGTVLQRTELTSAKGTEAILVLRDLPTGGESGKHTQSGNEIVYVLEGSLTLEVQGKPPATLKIGEAFATAAGEVHNVKNASASTRRPSLFTSRRRALVSKTSPFRRSKNRRGERNRMFARIYLLL